MKTLLVLCLATMLLLGFVGTQSASAATPTPSPTLRPIQPTATSNTQYLRPTPTPWALPTSEMSFAGFNGFNSKLGDAADTSIQIYNAVNQNHLLDLITGALTAVVVLAIIIGMFMSETEKD